MRRTIHPAVAAMMFFAGTFGQGGPAQAAEEMGGDFAYLTKDKSAYVRIGGGGAWLDVPRLNTLSFSGTGAAVFPLRASGPSPNNNAFSIDSAGPAIEGSFGFALPNEAVPFGGLTRPRFELGARYVGVSERMAGSDTCLTTFCTVLAIDGKGTGGIANSVPAANAGQLVDTRVRGDADLVEIPLTYRADLASYDGGAVTPTVSFGLLYGHMSQNYEISHGLQNPNVGQFLGQGHALQESLSMNYGGPTVGAGVTLRANDYISVTLDGQVGVYYASSRLRADQSVPGLANFGPRTVTDSDDAFGGRASISAGFNFDFGPGVLSLTGGVTYWSHIAQVRNPEASTGTVLAQAVGVAGSTNAASVDYSDMISWGGMMRLTFPLPGMGLK
jgi:hypothetical protein